MANSDSNNLKKSRIAEDRNQRTRMPTQPGAFGGKEGETSPERAERRSRRRFGATEQHTSDDRRRPWPREPEDS